YKIGHYRQACRQAVSRVRGQSACHPATTEPIMTLSRVFHFVAGITLAAGAPSAWAQAGTITFTGAVIASSCEVDSSGYTPIARNLSPHFTVDLPTITTGDLTARGQTAGWSPFAITLQHCDTSPNLVRTHFEPGTF